VTEFSLIFFIFVFEAVLLARYSLSPSLFPVSISLYLFGERAEEQKETGRAAESERGRKRKQAGAHFGRH